MAQEQTTETTTVRRRGRWKLAVLLLVCAAPLVASYLTYYVVKPDGRTNYGTILDQRAHPVPDMATTTLDGKARSLESLKGKWVMVRVGGGVCLEECQRQLWAMRQWRVMQGKNMDRIERAWLITDKEPVDTALIREYDDVEFLRAPRQAIEQWLPVPADTKLEDHIFLIDPQGHLMMRFPKQPEPRRVFLDLQRLLKASAVG